MANKKRKIRKFPDGGKVDEPKKFDVNNLESYRSLNHTNLGSTYDSLGTDPTIQKTFFDNYNKMFKPDMPLAVGKSGGIGVDWGSKQQPPKDVNFSMYKGYQNKQLYGKFGDGKLMQSYPNEAEYRNAYQNKDVAEYGLGGMIGKAIPIPGLGWLGGKIDDALAETAAARSPQDVLNDDREAMRKQHGLAMPAYQSGNTYSNDYAASYAMGGKVHDAGKTKIKVEKQERILEPDGDVIKINAGTHKSGDDATVNVDPNAYVFSDRLKASTGKTFAEELDISLKNIKRIDKNKGGSVANKNTRELMSNRERAKIAELQEENERERIRKENKKYKRIDKNIPERPWGGMAANLTNVAYQANTGTNPLWNNQLQGAAGVLGGMDWSGDSKPKEKKGPGVWDIGLGLAGLAPLAFNLSQGYSKADTLRGEDYYNPYGQESMSLMEDRRFNADPMLESNKLTQSTFNRNITRGGASSSGQLFSNLGAGSVSRQRADAGALAQKSNVDNQYLADEAKFKFGVGAQRADVDFKTDVFNQEAEAARLGMQGAGYSGISQWAQNQQAMQTQRKRDAGMAGILEETLGPIAQFIPQFMQVLQQQKGL